MGSSKADKKESSPYDIIRGMWEVPYAAQFINLFKTKFDFVDIRIQDLEDAFIDNSSVILADVCVRILRYLTEDYKILISTFEESLKSYLCDKNFDNSLVQGISWRCISPDERVVTLKCLIDHVFQEKEEELMEHLDDHHSPDDLRGICAGQDAFNNLYWYLDDLRLYRENCAKKVNKKDWECVCQTLTEWQSFLKQFRKTSNVNERELHTYLTEQLFPLIEKQLKCSSPKSSTLNNEALILREKQQLDAMFEHNNQISATSKTDKNSECNGLVLSNTAGIDETPQVPPLVALQQQHEDLLVNGGDKNDVGENGTNSNGDSVSDFNLSDVKIEAKDARTRDHTPPGGDLLTNGNGMLNLDSNLKNPVEGSVACDGDRSNLDLKNQENTKPTCLPHGIDVKDEKKPVVNISNNMGPTTQHQVPSNIAMGPPAPSATVQPLPSNVLNKTPVSSLDAQYMQQQSQIFVFSTSLANEGAEAVMQGHYPSMIMYHCDQPGTKAFLDKHPLKVQQFSRPNPAAWLNSLSHKPTKNIRFGAPAGPMMKTNGPMMNNMMNGPCNDMRMAHPGCGPNSNCWPGAPGMSNGPVCTNSMCWPSWGGYHPNQPPMQTMPGKCDNQMRPVNPASYGMPRHGSPRMTGPCVPGSITHGPGGCQPPPNGPMMDPMCDANQGPVVSDENLTPLQKQHRDKKFAKLMKIGEQLSIGNEENVPENLFGVQPPGGMMPQDGHQLPPHSNVSFNGAAHPTGAHPQMPPHQMMNPNSMSNQMEWQKLESQFYEDKKVKNVGGHNNTQFGAQSRSSMINNSPNLPPLDSNAGGTRMPGPPPPYPQQSPVRTTVASSNSVNIQQPSPISITSPASASISLPSPHSNAPNSSISSPAPPRIPQPSPGGTMPQSSAHGGNSMHNTPLNSPSPALNSNRPISNPTTPGGNTVMTSTSPTLRLQDPMSGPLTPNSIDNQPITAEGTFGRTLQSYAHSSQQRSGSGKEPSLMPVPSPQQIQYLNAFDGQELTIQKQPNTSIREPNMMSPANIPMTENGSQYSVPSPGNAQLHHQNPSTPQYCSPDQSRPPRPASENMCSKFQMDSVSPHFAGLSPQNGDPMQRFPNPSPHSHHMVNLDAHRVANPKQRFAGVPMNCPRMPMGGQEVMQRFHGPGNESMPRMPVMESGPRFRAPCRSPHHMDHSSMPPSKYQAMSSPQSNMVDGRFPVTSPGENMMHPRMRFPASGTATSSVTSPQGGSIPPGALSPHMQSLQKMTASFDMIGTPMSNKMHSESTGSPFSATNSNPGSVGANPSGPEVGQLHGQKLSHFDPLASMAEMTNPTGPSSTTIAPSSGGTHPSMPMMNNMNTTNAGNMQYGLPVNNPMGNVQNIPNSVSQSGPNVGSIINHQISQSVGAQLNVNNTYVNSNMSIQQMNAQNPAYNANVQVQPINAHPPVAGQQHRPNMYPSQGNAPNNAVAKMPNMNPRCVHPQHFMPQEQMSPHRGMSPAPMNPAMHRSPNGDPRPFNGANVQVKATAPNTIQYLPTRPQRATTANRPPSLEFLNRFTAPLSNLDNKVPTQNLQYFPNGGNNVNPPQNMGVNMNMMMVQPGNMNGSHAPEHMMEGQPMVPHGNQSMMVRAHNRNQQIVNSEQMYMSGAMHPSQVPTGPPMPVMNDQQNFGPMPGQMMTPQMIPVPQQQQQQMYMMGKPGNNMMAPDASQHLPPSMANQQASMGNPNFKSNFNGPTASDPNYAVQFHNFQQQLYATNPRLPTGHMNNPNFMGPQYYMPK